MRGTRWTFWYTVRPTLPPLAWVAEIGRSEVAVQCGESVRLTETGFVEGSWVGGGEIGSIVRSTTVFGTAIVASEEGLFIVPPSHTLEAVYLARRGDRVMAANSLVALLTASGLELDPAVAYPPLFILSTDGPSRPLQPLPVVGGEVLVARYENLRLGPAAELVVERRPREQPFASFVEYRARLSAALASTLANAPAYEPVVAMSSGYDSTAVAALAVGHGLRRALTLRTGKPVRGSASLDDSGSAAARALGLRVESFERLAYLERAELAEAEFLASGMAGEEVTLAAMEPALRRTFLLSGHYGDLMWDRTTAGRPETWRGDMSGCSLTEFRLRVDFLNVPLPVFGRIVQPSLPPVSGSPEMRRWSVGGEYDRPIARRLAEEAGVPRGSFADQKRAASATLHVDGLAAFSPASRRHLQGFAATEGRSLRLRPRPRLTRLERALIRVAKVLRLGPLLDRLRARRHALMTFEAEAGSLVFRWAVSVVRSRYSVLLPIGSDAPAGDGISASRAARRAG